MKSLKKNLLKKFLWSSWNWGRHFNCVAFLTSDMAKYINGETIHVNGGMYMATIMFNNLLRLITIYERINARRC